MNRIITSKRVKGKGVIYTTKCPVSTPHVDLFVGNPKTCNAENCAFFVKRTTNKEGKPVVHCNHI